MDQDFSFLSEDEKLSIELFKTFIQDTVKFRVKGTASAAARARKSASKLVHLLKPIRKALQEEKKVRVAEKRAKRKTKE